MGIAKANPKCVKHSWLSGIIIDDQDIGTFVEIKNGVLNTSKVLYSEFFKENNLLTLPIELKY
jgi:hypothetical protein